MSILADRLKALALRCNAKFAELTASVNGIAGSVTPQQFGASVSNSAAANSLAIQNAINAAAGIGGNIVFPPGIFSHAGLTFKNKVQYRGAGRDTNSTLGTVLLYTGTGDGVQINNPVNGSTAANVSIEGITFKNANRNSGKGCFADTGSTDLKFRSCSFVGGDRQLILDQSELVDVDECDFELTAAGSLAGVWIVNGADRTPGASAGFSNRISISRCQFDGNSTACGIVDDGGAAHSFVDNNYNACLNHIRLAGVETFLVIGGEFESAAGHCIVLTNLSLGGSMVGSSTGAFFGGIYSASAGHGCISIISAGQIEIGGGVEFATSGFATTPSVSGTSNAFRIHAGLIRRAFNDDPIFDGYATLTSGTDTIQSAIPTLGYYRQGQIIWNSAAVPGGKIGWVCVTSGSPGNWKPFGVIDA